MKANRAFEIGTAIDEIVVSSMKCKAVAEAFAHEYTESADTQAITAMIAANPDGFRCLFSLVFDTVCNIDNQAKTLQKMFEK